MRKKILPIIITLLALCSTKAFATDYDLWVAGVRVTSSNASHITSSGISGSVSYSYSTNTLTLSGASITCYDFWQYGIKSNIPGLKIQLEGSNTISTFNTGIWSQADLTIQGTGTLKVSSTDLVAIDAEGNLTFNNCAIEAISHDRDIYPRPGIRGTADKTLAVNGGSLTAQAHYLDRPIYGFGHLSMAAGASITYPANAYYDEVSQCLKYTDGTEVTEKAAIESVNRSLWVAGHKLGGGNSGTGTYIFTGEGITGTVTYDFGTNTLALFGSTITDSDDYDWGIESNIPGLKILLVGSNTIDTYWGGIRSEADMTIQGEGTLDVISNAMHAINAKGNLTFNSTIEARCESFGNGIIGTSEKTLTVNGGMLTAQACVNDGYYTISGFGHLSMTGVSITYPANVHYDEDSRRLEYADGSAVTVEVVIEPVNHSLWVAGHKLGGGNSGTGSYTFTGTGITGTVTYDFGSNTLSLSNASVIASGSGNYGIKSNIPGLKIQLVGSNSISTSSYGICSYADMTIQGSGTLNVTSSHSTAIYTTCNLTIENCTVEVMSMDTSTSTYYPNYAIYGTSGKTLAVNGGSLTAQAHYLDCPIYGFGHLSMAEGISITYPANVHYDELDRRLEYADDFAVRGKAAIESDNRSLWVAGHKLGSGNSVIGPYTYTFTGTGITGTVTYSFVANTLALSNASIIASGRGNYGIESNIPGLKIQLVGNSTNTINTTDYGIYAQADMTIQGTGTLNVTSTGSTAIYAQADMTIQGTGTLNVTADQDNAINAEGNLTFSSCTVEARSNRDIGIRGTSGKTLTVNGGSLTAEGGGTNGYPISGFGHLSMAEGTSITYPANVHYDEAYKRLIYAESRYVYGEAVIESGNPSLWVAGHKLGGGNSGTGTYTFTGTGITGTVTYDFGTNTLSLSNASITASDDGNSSIASYIPGLTIQLEGINTISAYYYGIYSEADMTIQGTGTLNVTASHSNAINVKGNLTFSNCTVEARSNDNRGILGTGEKTLTVNGGSLTAQGSGTYGYPISGFGHLSMAEGTSITYPANVHYDEFYRLLKYANGNSVYGEAAIESVNHSLWVAGHRLGGGNSGTGTYTFIGTGITGTVTYSFGANTLALSNASVIASGSGNYGIESNIPGLKIQLVSNSTNTINTTDYGIYAQADLTIQGTGTLNVTADQDNAINAEGNLTFSSCTVEARSNSGSGIKGTSEKTLTVNGGSLTAQGSGTSGYPISDFGHLSMAEGTSITYPANAHYDEYDSRLEYASGNAVTGEAAIESVNHSLWVAGHKLGGGNSGTGTYAFIGTGITGTVTYDFGTNTLALINASVIASGSGNYGIESNIPGLKIQLTGSNSISTSSYGIYSQADMTIQGTGTLNVTGSTAIKVTDDLTLSNCTVEARSSGNYSYGIYGTSGKTLAVNGGSLTAVGGTNGYPVFGFGHLSMAGTSITYPANVHYDEFYSRLEYADGYPVYGEAVIELVQYDIWVKGTRVTGANASDVLDDGGTVIYDAEENTLTLNGATITSTSDNAIKNQMSGLKIVLVGNNTVNSTIASGIFSNQDFFIEGNGSLYVTGKDGIYAVGCNLTISGGCAVAATGNGGDNYGGVYGSQTKTLTISESTVMAQTSSTNRSGITGFGNLTLNHIEITTPSGGTYHDGNVYDGNTLYYGKYNNQIRPVVICPILYSLFVHGVQVTSVNANDVLNDGGKVIYDAEENTLTLNGARVMSSSDCGISNQIPGLKIVLVGLNTISSTGSIGILSNQDFFIEGSGSLEATGNNGHGICASNCDLTIRGGCTVSATGNGSYYQGIYGFSPHTLTISESTVTAWTSSTVSSAITGFSNLTLNNIEIMTPTGGTYHDGNVYNGNEIYYGKYNNQIRPVVISRIPYDLYVKGTQVTSANAFDVLNDGGTVIYDAEENTLTLNGATITSSSGYAIKNQMAGLKIVLVGNNTVSATGSTSIFSNQDFFIEGRGSLVATGNNSHGICASNCDLTIRGGCTVTASGTGTYNQGIYGFPSHTLTISESVVTAMTSSTLYSAIHGFRNLVLNEMEITTPSGGTYHDGDVYNGSTIYYGKYNNQIRPVVISPIPYQLWVKGTQITAANAPDVFNDGTVSYDAIDNVLTLNGAAISGGGSRGIENKIANLKIALVGNNAITSSSSGIFSNTNFFIEGRGTLNVTGNDGIYASLCNLTIQGGCDLTITGTGTSNYAGIYGSSGKTLTIDRSKVTVSSASTQKTAICNFTTLDLGEVSMTTPANGSYSYGVVKDNGSAYYGQVVISPFSYDLYVKGTQVTSANAFDVLNDGTVSYDAIDNVLTLNGAAISGGYSRGIENKIANLKIALVGNNAITSSSSGIFSNKNFFIEGRGTLNVTGNDGIYASLCNLTIQGGCDLTITGTGTSNCAGIYGSSGRTLTIDRSKVTVSSASTQMTAICNFTTLDLGEVSMTMPANGSYSYGVVKDNGSAYYGQVVISPISYNLYVKDIQVTSANAFDVLNDGGTVIYDAEENVLTLNGATITCSSNQVGISNQIPGLRIALEGSNTIISNNSGIYSGQDFIIEGRGTLDVTGYDGIYAYYCDLIIRGGCTINAMGNHGDDYGGIYGSPAKTLTISQSKVTAATSSTIYSGITGFDYLVLDDTEITTPYGGFYYYGNVKVGNEVYYGSYNNQIRPVVISPTPYQLWVKGTQITAANAPDVFGDGTVSYDVIDNELTLNGATIEYLGSNHDGIRTGISNLTIKLLGDNNITSGDDGIEIGASRTNIVGPGTLTMNSSYGIYCSGLDCSLTIKEAAKVVINGTTMGVDMSNSNLVVDCAELWAKGETQSIGCLGLTRIRTSITAPEGAVFSTYAKGVVESEGSSSYVKGTYVKITPDMYPLWIAGTQVTAINAEDVLGDGTVSYDVATNTLTLNGATVYDAEYGSGIIDYIDGLNIVLEGGNSIETLGGDGISLYANATISGTGRLDVNARYGIYGYDNYLNDLPSLTLEGGCQVSVAATEDGVNIGEGLMNVGGVLTVDNSTLEVTKENSLHTSIKCRDLVLVGTEVVTPEGYHFNEYNSLVGPTGVVPMYVLIGPIRYDLWVANTQVTAANAAHITGEGISGTVSYDAATNTLTLDNAFIENSPDGGDGYGIVSEIDGLTISLRGENSIISNEDGVSLYNVNTSITGGGMLNIYSPYGIYGYSGTNNVTLTISNESTVSLDCSSQGIYLNSMALSIDRSTVEVFGDANCGVYASNGWQLIDVEITSPSEAYWNGYYVLDAEGQVVGGGIVIEPIKYELYLADTQVTALNAADVLGEGISGTVSYDATTNTLTLNEATITNEGGRGIETDIDNLNIVLVGTNTIQTIDGEGIRLFADATISGTGSLAIEAWYGIYGYITDGSVLPSLTLEGGCQVNVDAIEVGINIFWDLESTGGVLTVDNSTLEVTKDENSYFATTVQCRDLVLNGVEVTDPEAYYFNEYYELVGSDDQVPNRVLIEPYNVFTGTVSGDWNNPSNWSKGELPLATSKVHIAVPCVMDEDAEVKRIVIEETGSMNLINGAVLTVETITNSDASRFVITNGQLYCDNEVSGTFHKTVTIADADENGWNAIAVPMNSPSIANLTANTYDIYTYDEDADQNEWQNYKDSPFSFVPGQGYLYANSDFTDLVMTGTFKPSSQTVTIPLSYGAQYEGIRGFNLVGNPYPRKLSMSEIKIGGEPITIYYRLVEGTNGSEFVPCTSGDILPGEGFFIKATEAGQVLTIGGE